MVAYDQRGAPPLTATTGRDISDPAPRTVRFVSMVNQRMDVPLTVGGIRLIARVISGIFDGKLA